MKILLSLFFYFVLASLVLVQTEYTTTAQIVTQSSYSESKPYQPREFLVNKNSKPKKEKKSKENSQSTNEINGITNLLLKTDETITIPVSVFDSNGHFVTNLKQSDFKVFVDGNEQEILSVSKRNEAINLILLVDTSPSTAHKIEEIQNYALAIVQKLKPEDMVMILSFNRQTKLLAEMTSDRKVIFEAIRKLKFGDGTSLYEVIKNTFDKYVSQISDRTAVVLLTDGVDTTSREADYANSLLVVEKKNVPVFPVYFDTFAGIKQLPANTRRVPDVLLEALRDRYRQRQKGSTVDEYEIGKMYLNDISLLSGGRPRAVKDITDTKAINVDNISGELRLQYRIRFRLPDFTADKRKQMTVRINQPNLLVQARGSLIADED
jgi:VWFA-related protein